MASTAIETDATLNSLLTRDAVRVLLTAASIPNRTTTRRFIVPRTSSVVLAIEKIRNPVVLITVMDLGISVHHGACRAATNWAHTIDLGGTNRQVSSSSTQECTQSSMGHPSTGMREEEVDATEEVRVEVSVGQALLKRTSRICWSKVEATRMVRVDRMAASAIIDGKNAL